MGVLWFRSVRVPNRKDLARRRDADDEGTRRCAYRVVVVDAEAELADLMDGLGYGVIARIASEVCDL